jgi:diguanylate cyclase (GGDEF)-like protein
MNQAARHLLGLRGPTLPGLSEALQLLDRTSRAKLTPALIADLRRGLPVSLPPNTCLVSAEGMEFQVAGGGIPLGDGAVLTLRDVTEANTLPRPAVEQGDADAVTGLPPQRLLVERLERNLLSKRAVDRELSYLHIELDGIDRLVREAGQAVADQALRQAAQILLSRIRDSDTLARVGEHAFGLLLPACPREISERLLQTLLASIAAMPFEWRGTPYPLTARIGIVHAPPFAGAYDECQAQAVAAVAPPATAR